MQSPDNHNFTEKELAEGCAQGIRKYQEALYRKYSAKMYAVCLRYTNKGYLAEDILQEGFIKVFNSIGSYRNEGSLEGWIRIIVVRTALNYLRSSAHIHMAGDSELTHYENYQHSALDSLVEDDLLELISSLPDGCRTVFNLYAIEGFNHKEIGEMLQINDGTSKSQFARARMLLQRKIMGVKNDSSANDSV